MRAYYVRRSKRKVAGGQEAEFGGGGSRIKARPKFLCEYRCYGFGGGGRGGGVEEEPS